MIIPSMKVDHLFNTLTHHKVKYAGRGHVNPAVVAEMSELKCLATMIYGEARGESRTGMVAVAYSAVNRAVKKTVCDVVLAPKQYSIFNNNPALREVALTLHIAPRQKNSIDEKSWDEAMAVAKKVLTGKIKDPTNGATHYLAPDLMKIKKYKYPRWSRQFELVAVIDNHKFYKDVK